MLRKRQKAGQQLTLRTAVVTVETKVLCIIITTAAVGAVVLAGRAVAARAAVGAVVRVRTGVDGERHAADVCLAQADAIEVAQMPQIGWQGSHKGVVVQNELLQTKGQPVKGKVQGRKCQKFGGGGGATKQQSK